jgi:enoyl-CoA hydratase/carnithine racemase
MTVELEMRDDVAILTLARPERHNAFDRTMKDALAQRLGQVERNQARAVVVTGRGRSFCSGADLDMLDELSAEDASRFMFDATACFRRLAALPVPVLAAVTGYCLGGGFELALHCDAIVSTDDAVFGFPETSLGLVTTSGSVARLIDAVGVARARDVLLLGRRLRGADASSFGLARELVPAAGLLDAALAAARGVAIAPRDGIAAMKRLVAAVVEDRASQSFVAELDAFTRLVRQRKEATR